MPDSSARGTNPFWVDRIAADDGPDSLKKLLAIRDSHEPQGNAEPRDVLVWRGRRDLESRGDQRVHGVLQFACGPKWDGRRVVVSVSIQIQRGSSSAPDLGPISLHIGDQ